VDGEVKSVGKIPTKDEIKGWIEKIGQNATDTPEL
jgi:hypothetical protein